MTVTLLITCLFGILGIALLVLARLEPGQAHICDWGWSHLLLSVGLLLGVALAPRHLVSALHRLQALAALSAIVASLALQLAGAALPGAPLALGVGCTGVCRAHCTSGCPRMAEPGVGDSLGHAGAHERRLALCVVAWPND